MAAIFMLIAYIAFGQLNYNDADRNFENLFYVKAAAQYEQIIQNGDDSQKVLQRIGDAYFFNTDTVSYTHLTLPTIYSV